MELTINDIYKGLLGGPAPQDTSQAQNLGLLTAGLGLLGRRNLGDAGLMGVGQYQSELARLDAQRKNGLQQALLAMQVKKQMDQQEALKGLYSGQGGAGGAAQAALAAGAAQGDIGPTMTNAARMGAPTPNLGPNLQQLGALRAAGIDIKPDLQLYELNNPKKEVSGGYAYDPRTVGNGFIPQLKLDDKGNAVLAAPDAQGVPNVTNAPGSLGAIQARIRAEEGTKTEYSPFLGELDANNRPIPQTTAGFLQKYGTQRAIPAPMVSPVRESLPTEAQAIERLRQLEAQGKTGSISVTPSGNTLAPALGSTLPPASSLGMGPTMDQKEFAATANKNDADYLKSLREGSDAAAKGMQGINFMREQIKSGAMGGRLAPGMQAAGEFLLGMHVPLSDSVVKSLRSGQNFNKATQEAALSQLKFYVGAQNISDADRNAVMALAARLQDDPKARIEWIDFIENRLKTQEDKFRSADAYVNQNGSLRGWSYKTPENLNPSSTDSMIREAKPGASVNVSRVRRYNPATGKIE